MSGSMNDKKTGYFPIIIIFTATIVLTMVAGSILERAVWSRHARSCKSHGIAYRKDTGVVSDQEEEGLAAFKYQDDVLYFRWSTLGSPWKQGFWPFIETAEVKAHEESTGMRLRMALGAYETQQWR